MTIRSILVTFLMSVTILLSSCATGFYARPGKQEPAAVIRGTSTRDGLTTWMETRASMIDDKDAGIIFSVTQPLRIYPGKHNITIYTEYNHGMFTGGPFDALNEVSFTALANHEYRVKSSVKGKRVLSWVESKQGKRVSNISSTLARFKPQSTVVVVSR